MNHNVVAVSTLARLRALVALMRPRHWVKNLFVLAPLVFSGAFTDVQALSKALEAMLLFCVASSTAYIINDIHDIECDRRHPRKSRTRPLAAGIVSVPAALGLLATLYGVLLVVGWATIPRVLWVIGGYMVLNIAYTFVLKYRPVIDIFTIAVGFVLRVYAGAIALDIPVSSWMFVTTLCLALYLAAVKRRAELLGSGRDGRKVLEKYSIALVERYAEMSATGALVFYSLFVMSARPQLVITVPLVLFGLFRYWFVVEQLEGGESPTDALLGDWQLLAVVAAWGGVCMWALWPAMGA